jgi:hypothetical protein
MLVIPLNSGLVAISAVDAPGIVLALLGWAMILSNNSNISERTIPATTSFDNRGRNEGNTLNVKQYNTLTTLTKLIRILITISNKIRIITTTESHHQSSQYNQHKLPFSSVWYRKEEKGEEQQQQQEEESGDTFSEQQDEEEDEDEEKGEEKEEQQQQQEESGDTFFKNLPSSSVQYRKKKKGEEQQQQEEEEKGEEQHDEEEDDDEEKEEQQQQQEEEESGDTSPGALHQNEKEKKEARRIMNRNLLSIRPRSTASRKTYQKECPLQSYYLLG